MTKLNKMIGDTQRVDRINLKPLSNQVLNSAKKVTRQKEMVSRLSITTATQ